MSQALPVENFDQAAEATPQSFDQERERIHRQMLSSVSHDLKTPLASIIGSLEVYTRLKDKLTPDKQATLIHVALQESYRLDAFISNILDMAKLENGLVNPKPELLEIGNALRSCLTRLGQHFPEGSVDMQAISGIVKADIDAVLLSRVMCLVFDNAIKHGGKPVKVWIEFGKNENRTAYINIRDNGPGISKDRMESVFHKYTRFAKEDQQNAGTGLGLAIAREIMRLLRGQLTAENHPEGGAMFTLRFPLEQQTASL